MLKFRLLLGVRGVGLALFFSAIYPGVAAERQVLHGHVPAAVARFNLQPTGQLPATNRLALAIGLPLRNPEGDPGILVVAVADPLDAAALDAVRVACGGLLPEAEIKRLRKECATKGVSLHAALMERCGWPAICYDGQLLVSHQDALLLGGKVQAPPGYADHVVFLYPELCERCGTKICIEH